MKTINMLLLIIVLFFFVGCGGKKLIQQVLPIETETKMGESIIKIEPEKTGDRMDIPVDVKPSEVVAKIETKSGAKVWVVKKKRFLRPAKIEILENKKAVQEQIKIDAPKKSYAWLYWLIGVPALLIFMNYALVLSIGFNPIAWIGERIFKRKK